MPTKSTTTNATRRTVLRGAAGTLTAGLAAGAVDPVAAQSSDEPDYGDWFENTSNYEETVDRTGEDTVTITVGASGNNGNLAFGPAAVRVDPGTTVVWEWTGEGGTHNVIAESGAFESELTDETGFTFEHTLEQEGVLRYACGPHKQMGMKGALVVGDPETAESGGLETVDLLTVGGALGLGGGLLSLFAYGARGDR
jgi:halocyanin-like protein